MSRTSLLVFTNLLGDKCIFYFFICAVILCVDILFWGQFQLFVFRQGLRGQLPATELRHVQFHAWGWVHYGFRDTTSLLIMMTALVMILLLMTMIYTVYALDIFRITIHGCRQLRTRLSPRKSFARRRKRRANNTQQCLILMAPCSGGSAGRRDLTWPGRAKWGDGIAGALTVNSERAAGPPPSSNIQWSGGSIKTPKMPTSRYERIMPDGRRRAYFPRVRRRRRSTYDGPAGIS